MRKSAKAFRTITEVAEILELPAHVLRFWESKFKYIKPMKRGGGRRYYRPEDISLLLGIKHLLYSDGMTIKGAQKIIQTNGVKATSKLGSQNNTSQENVRPKEDTASPLNVSMLRFHQMTKGISLVSRGTNNEKLEKILSSLQDVCDRIKARTNKKTVA